MLSIYHIFPKFELFVEIIPNLHYLMFSNVFHEYYSQHVLILQYNPSKMSLKKKILFLTRNKNSFLDDILGEHRED
jgi:hypothetical protein